MSNKLCRISFVVEDNDASNEICPKLNFQVANSYTYSQALFFVLSNNCLFVLGGLNLSTFSMLNELYGVRSYDTKIIQPPGGISIRKVEGEILRGKIGRSYTYIFLFLC